MHTQLDPNDVTEF